MTTTETWQAPYGEAPPIGHRFRAALPKRWLRLHCGRSARCGTGAFVPERAGRVCATRTGLRLGSEVLSVEVER